MGLNWLHYFLRYCADCRIDFICIHWYEDGLSAAQGAADFKNHVETASHLFDGRKLWITEFRLNSNDAEQEAFMKAVIPWLDRQSYVERYAYFMATPGMLVNGAGTGLTTLGRIHNTL